MVPVVYMVKLFDRLENYLVYCVCRLWSKGIDPLDHMSSARKGALAVGNIKYDDVFVVGGRCVRRRK